MKDKFIALSVLIYCYLIAYSATSFIVMSIDSSEWHWAARAFCFFFGLWTFGIVCSWVYIGKR